MSFYRIKVILRKNIFLSKKRWESTFIHVVINVNISLFYFFPLFSLSIVLGVRSVNFFSVWVGIELNMIVFIVLLSIVRRGRAEAPLKYFIIQAVASNMLFFRVLMMRHANVEVFVFLAIFLKLGLAPCHQWYVTILEKVSWGMFFLLSTVQKILPLFGMSIFLALDPLVLFVGLSSVYAAFCMINQLVLKRVLAYSRMFNIGWMVCAAYSPVVFLKFFSIYTVTLLVLVRWLEITRAVMRGGLSLRVRKLEKNVMLLVIGGVAGIPPLLGFWGKVIVLELIFLRNSRQRRGFIIVLLFISGVPLYAYVGMARRVIFLTRFRKVFFYRRKPSLTLARFFVVVPFPLFILYWVSLKK